MNIIDYVNQNLHTFQQEAFNEIDGLILSWLSYIRWPKDTEVNKWKGIALKDFNCAEFFDEMFLGLYEETNTRHLFTAVAASPRFRNCKLKGYISHFDVSEEKQFCAVTIEYENNRHFISFRGTDSTLIGWKEDFNMAFTCPVPAQLEAVRYINDAAAHTEGSLQLGGHSKGGNLAVYAAAYNSVIFDRLEKVYSFDGPGFIEEVRNSDALKKVEPLACKIVPQSSVIGMIMDEKNGYRAVESDAVGFWQHNAFTWKIKDHDFVYISELDNNAIVFDRTVNDWLQGLSKEERERFIDTLFSLTENVNAITLAELNANGKENYSLILNSLVNLDEDSKKFVFRVIKDLIKQQFVNFPDYLTGIKPVNVAITENT